MSEKKLIPVLIVILFLLICGVVFATFKVILDVQSDIQNAMSQTNNDKAEDLNILTTTPKDLYNETKDITEYDNELSDSYWRQYRNLNSVTPDSKLYQNYKYAISKGLEEYNIPKNYTYFIADNSTEDNIVVGLNYSTIEFNLDTHTNKLKLSKTTPYLLFACFPSAEEISNAASIMNEDDTDKYKICIVHNVDGFLNYEYIN